MTNEWFAVAGAAGMTQDAPYQSTVSFSLDREPTAAAPDPQRRPELADVSRLARRGLRTVVKAARAEETPTPAKVIHAFLGAGADEAEIVEETWASYEMVNVQRALDAWVAMPGRTHRLIGIQSINEDASLAGMLMPGGNPFSGSLGNISRTNLPSGPDGESIACVRYGLYLVSSVEDPTDRVVMLLCQANPMRGRPRVSVQILAGDPDTARDVGGQLRALARDLNVFRGQILTFGGDMFGDGESILTFHRRPTMTRADLILDDEVLATIERQIIGVAKHREALLAAGQHLKRGVLLYGPPGVGKTHTIRYLMSTLTDVTVIQLTGDALQFISDACSAARSLAPSIVVVEDVDLIAEDRGSSPGEHPMLFQLLNEMDGVGGDVDVAFVLTTNRADLLEPALAARPGRVDEAVAIDLPDLDARRRLFDLYRGSLQIEADDDQIATALGRAEGVTASFLKELLRRTALAAAERSAADPAASPGGPLTATAEDLDSALTGLLSTRSRMTRALLGTADDEPWLDHTDPFEHEIDAMDENPEQG